MSDFGRFLVIIGVATALVGFFLWSGLAPKWLGRLSGDIRIERGNFSLYFPIVTCIVISVILTLIFSLFRR
jgi:p-aminobenzoyl-glutamate transporter AbgT